MLFVNDLAGIRGIPWWAKHMPSTVDGMTPVDLVFPCFLFVVGVSIPLAIGRRMDQGEPLSQTLKTILVRSLSLVAVGVLMVNMGQQDGYVLSKAAWGALAYVAIILLWLGPSNQPSPRAVLAIRSARAAGLILLAGLLIIYRAPTEDHGTRWLQPQWWGILGLIGWAYLTVALWWRTFPHDRAAMVGFIGLLTCLGLAKRGAESFFTSTPILSTINGWIEVGGQIGGHGSIVAAGALLGMMMRSGEPWRPFLAQATAWGTGLVVAGFCLRPYTNGFSKDFATPAWCLLCAGLSCWLLAISHALLTARRPEGSPLLSPHAPIIHSVVVIGQWALIPYLLAPLFINILALTPLESFYAAPPLGIWPGGILRAALLTLAIAGLSHGIIRAGLKLRL
jgi:predicted acyltransferase